MLIVQLFKKDVEEGGWAAGLIFLGKFIMIPLCLAQLALAGWSAGCGYVGQLLTRDWLPAQAVMIDIKHYSPSKIKPVYTYVVDNVRYESDTMVHCELLDGSLDYYEIVPGAEDFPTYTSIDRPVNIFYDPSKPSRATIIRERWAYTSSVWGVFYYVLAVAVFWLFLLFVLLIHLLAKHYSARA